MTDELPPLLERGLRYLWAAPVSLIAWNGGDPYRDNPFEQEARAGEA